MYIIALVITEDPITGTKMTPFLQVWELRFGEIKWFHQGYSDILFHGSAKSLITTYPLISRHQLNLERNSMKIIYVEKPPEEILTILHPRELTQERDAMNVKNMGSVQLSFVA